MRFLKEFNDEQIIIYDVTKVRVTARAFVIDKSKNIALISYSGEYRGNSFSFHTTPGGGVEGNETPKTAVKREVMEEIGYECNILHEVGIIIDYFTDQVGKIITNYFIAEPTEKKQGNWTKIEKRNIKSIKWVDIDAAEQILADMPPDPIGRAIQRRDLHALMEVKRIIKLSCTGGCRGIPLS